MLLLLLTLLRLLISQLLDLLGVVVVQLLDLRRTVADCTEIHTVGLSEILNRSDRIGFQQVVGCDEALNCVVRC